jgi:hypothetical protein
MDMSNFESNGMKPSKTMGKGKEVHDSNGVLVYPGLLTYWQTRECLRMKAGSVVKLVNGERQEFKPPFTVRNLEEGADEG